MDDKDYEDFHRLKQAVLCVLSMTYAAGNGGFRSNFGVATFIALAETTGFTWNKRKLRFLFVDNLNDDITEEQLEKAKEWINSITIPKT